MCCKNYVALVKSENSLFKEEKVKIETDKNIHPDTLKPPNVQSYI